MRLLTEDGLGFKGAWWNALIVAAAWNIDEWFELRPNKTEFAWTFCTVGELMFVVPVNVRPLSNSINITDENYLATLAQAGFIHSSLN